MKHYSWLSNGFSKAFFMWFIRPPFSCGLSDLLVLLDLLFHVVYQTSLFYVYLSINISADFVETAWNLFVALHDYYNIGLLQSDYYWRHCCLKHLVWNIASFTWHPYVRELKSYVKKSTVSNKKINNLGKIHENSILVTMDVCSLYQYSHWRRHKSSWNENYYFFEINSTLKQFYFQL